MPAADAHPRQVRARTRIRPGHHPRHHDTELLPIVVTMGGIQAFKIIGTVSLGILTVRPRSTPQETNSHGRAP